VAVHLADRHGLRLHGHTLIAAPYAGPTESRHDPSESSGLHDSPSGWDSETFMTTASAMTTLNIYGHMWPDADESTRTAVSVVLAARMESVAQMR
jgi:hypothetical protein